MGVWHQAHGLQLLNMTPRLEVPMEWAWGRAPFTIVLCSPSAAHWTVCRRRVTFHVRQNTILSEHNGPVAPSLSERVPCLHKAGRGG